MEEKQEKATWCAKFTRMSEITSVDGTQVFVHKASQYSFDFDPQKYTLNIRLCMYFTQLVEAWVAADVPARVFLV